MCFTLGASIAEIVSAYPTCGGLYVPDFGYLVKSLTQRVPSQVHGFGPAHTTEASRKGKASLDRLCFGCR